MIDTGFLSERIVRPPRPVAHREDDFASEGFAQLLAMQSRHFWYRGRHRFLLHAVRRVFQRRVGSGGPPRLLDLGGGCGGWIAYWLQHAKDLPTAELGLADSSDAALAMAAEVLPASVGLYQADVLDLPWRDRWEAIFLLDVIEHLDDDVRAVEQAAGALVPGGLLFVTVPAFWAFWSWVDAYSGHRRRYRKADARRLAAVAGLELVEARYFQFLLSPLLLAERLVRRPGREDPADADRLIAAMHRVPPPPVNAALAAVFACETPLGHLLPFPWGTSLLAVLRKPAADPPPVADDRRRAEETHPSWPPASAREPS